MPIFYLDCLGNLIEKSNLTQILKLGMNNIFVHFENMLNQQHMEDCCIIIECKFNLYFIILNAS